MRFLLASTLFVAVLVPLTVACSAEDSSDARNGSEAIVAAGGGVGTTCAAADDCGPGLVCKGPSSGPPPGAVGLPIQPQGLPIQVVKTCQRPSAGEAGASCSSSADCNPGLVCSTSGASSSSSSGGSSGTVQVDPIRPQGLPSSGGPIQPAGTCRPSLPPPPPPVALGLPLQP